MAKKAPVTPAVRVLREHGVRYVEHLYRWEQGGGARGSAEKLLVPLHEVIKTLVLEDETRRPLLFLQHGDLEVSTKALARFLGVKTIEPCDPAVAERHTGYKVGGTSPFGTRKPLPVYMQPSIAELPRLLINGGARGFLVELAPEELRRVLAPVLVDAAAS